MQNVKRKKYCKTRSSFEIKYKNLDFLSDSLISRSICRCGTWHPILLFLLILCWDGIYACLKYLFYGDTDAT